MAWALLHLLQAQLISFNNSGAARAHDQSVQRLDLHSHKQAEGLEKDRFIGVKIHGRKPAFTLENRLSRQFHCVFTVMSRCFRVDHGPLCSHQTCCVKTCWGGTGFVESKRGNSMNNPSIYHAMAHCPCKKQASAAKHRRGAKDVKEQSWISRGMTRHSERLCEGDSISCW